MKLKIKHNCHICGYKWSSKLTTPKACPKCKRYDYNIVKKGGIK